MKRNISYKIYDTSLFVLAIAVIFNIIGLWVTWTHPSNPLGYVAGSFTVVCLIAEGFLSFCNERVSVRKHMIMWAIFLGLHLMFFIIIAVQIHKYGNNNYIGAALFTILLVGMLAPTVYFVVRKRLINKNKPYVVTPTSVDDAKTPTNLQDGEIVSPTIRIKVDQQPDNTPSRFIQPEEVAKPKQDNQPSKEDKNPKTDTDIITL